MTKAEALTKWAKIYKTVLIAKSFAGTCIDTAVQFGVMDMTNQTKGMSDADAAYMINDDADWMAEKNSA